MRKVNYTTIFRKRSLPFLTAFPCFILCLCHKGFAENAFYYQQPVVDSVPKNTAAKLGITVRNRENGAWLDSAYVVAGTQKGYTDSKGYLEFDGVNPNVLVMVSKPGYYMQAKKLKPILQFSLTKKTDPSLVSSVNNGLYERPAELFPGSASAVTGNDLRKINSLNFAEALKYYDPSIILSRDNNNGDNPNTTPDIKIRGSYNFPASASIASSSGTMPSGVQINPSSADFVADNIAKPNQPVFFVNGVQVALQSALDLDINRIEKVTILKDAAATAVYGVRGGNGVILIETTRPQNGKMKVSYSGQVQVSNADLSSYHLMNAQEKLQFEQDNGFYASNPDLLRARQNQVNKGVQTDWLQVPLRSAISQKHSLALDGGDDDLTYGLDFTYNDIEGAMKGSSRKSTNFGGYVSNRIKNAVFSNYLTYYKVNAANSPYGSFDSYVKQNSYWNPFDSVTGQMTKLMEGVSFRGTNYSFFNPAYNGTLSTKDATDYSRLANTTKLNWNMGRGFNLNGLVAYSHQSEQTNQFLPPGHTAFANYAPADFFKRGFYNQNNSVFSSMEAALHLNYNKQVGLHQFYASAGGSAIQTESESTGVTVAGFTSDKMSDLAFGSAYSTLRPATGKVVTRLASGYGDINYSYDSRYQAEISGNLDASAQSGNPQQVAPHWSAAASWNLHREKFFHNNKLVNQLRLRASIGSGGESSFLSYLGHTSFNYYTDRQYIQGGSTPNNRGIGLGAFLTGFANDSLRAPQTYKQNIGLDAVLLNNRLSIRVDAYHQKTTDLILPVASPAYTGFQNFSYFDNLGAIDNKGLEIALNYNIICNTHKSIYWNVSVNVLHNEDRIMATSAFLDKVNTANDATTVDQTRPQPHFVVGQSLTGIWVARSLRVDPRNGKEVFLKPDGNETFNWNEASKIVAGDMTPKWQGSFGTSVVLKKFSAGIYFNYQLNVQGYNQTLVDRVENANMLYNTDVRAAESRWKQAWDIVQFKPVSLNGLATAPTYATSRFVQDNAFVNCSTVSMGYTLPQHLAAKIGAQGLKIGLMGNNLFGWHAMQAERGIYYPFQKQYSFSVNANF